MDVVQLLSPEGPCVDRLWMYATLPKTVAAILPSGTPQGLDKTCGQVRVTVLGKLAPSESAKVRERTLQTPSVKGLIEEDSVYVARHDDVGVDTKVLSVVTEVEAVGDNGTSLFGDEHG